jgi:hypothetical protein
MPPSQRIERLDQGRHVRARRLSTDSGQIILEPQRVTDRAIETPSNLRENLPVRFAIIGEVTPEQVNHVSR